MIQESIKKIKAQNMTIDNALRQNKKWSDDIAEEADNHRRKINE